MRPTFAAVVCAVGIGPGDAACRDNERSLET